MELCSGTVHWPPAHVEVTRWSLLPCLCGVLQPGRGACGEGQTRVSAVGRSTRAQSALSQLSGCALLFHTSSCAAPWAGYSQAPAVTCFGINCSVDNPYPTTAPDPVASSAWLSGSPCAALRGTMRGLFLAPPLPRAATRHTAPVSARSDGAWC